MSVKRLAKDVNANGQILHRSPQSELKIHRIMDLDPTYCWPNESITSQQPSKCEKYVAGELEHLNEM